MFVEGLSYGGRSLAQKYGWGKSSLDVMRERVIKKYGCSMEDIRDLDIPDLEYLMVE